MYSFSLPMLPELTYAYRHLYAIYCLVQRQLQAASNGGSPEPNGASHSPPQSPVSDSRKITKMPSIFKDPGWATLGTSILSTSNCGNPALRLFGFGPVAADGYGIGYIIKEDGISMYAFRPLLFYYMSLIYYLFKLCILQTLADPSILGHAQRVSP